MLVNTIQMLKKARKGKYAIPAFNVNNLEMLQGVLRAALELRSPLILQTSEGAIEYAGMEYLSALIHTAANNKIPIAMHLDHGKNFDLVIRCIRSGYYTSVMFDGSALSYKENITLTKKIVKEAHKRNISVEAELGAIAGIEDFVSVEEKDAHFTQPEQALEFVQLTGCDSLAIAIGTAHGAYKFKDKAQLDLARLKKIATLVPIPLVLHGASEIDKDFVALAEKYGADLGDAKGLDNTLLKQAVKLGVSKVNIDSDLRIAFDAGVREVVSENPKVFDPRKILSKSIEYMYEVACEKIQVLSSKNKA